MTGSPGPALTIVTPVYNGERYIAETVRSVLADMAPNDAYIVVDDGSRDGTPEILDGLGDRVRLLRQSNQGEIAAVNAGVAATPPDVDIVGIVNADDPIRRGLLAAVRAAFADDPNLSAVYPDWIEIDADGQKLASVRTYEFDYEVLLAEHMCIPGPGAFFRKSVLAGEPVRDPLAAGISDYDFWLRFARRGARIRRIPETLATWRLHEGGTTVVAQGAELAATKIKVIERLLNLPDLQEAVRALGPRALSAAYYHAALVGLRTTGVPSLRYAVKSYVLAPRWPGDVLSHQRRSFPHLAYAALQPLSGRAHALASPLLPRRYRRDAIIRQTFGLDVPANR